jgi:hypothetical protein
VPPRLQTIVLLDGQPGPGALLRTQAAPGIEFRHSGRIDADTALLEILVARPFTDRRATVVVSDDRALRDRVRHGGGTAQRLDWLRALMDRASRPAMGSDASGTTGGAAGHGPPTGIGRPSVPRPPRPGTAQRGPRDDATAEDERRPWTPGRGATRKRGNSRKGRG